MRFAATGRLHVSSPVCMRIGRRWRWGASGRRRIVAKLSAITLPPFPSLPSPRHFKAQCVCVCVMRAERSVITPMVLDADHCCSGQIMIGENGPISKHRRIVTARMRMNRQMARGQTPATCEIAGRTARFAIASRGRGESSSPRPESAAVLLVSGLWGRWWKNRSGYRRRPARSPHQRRRIFFVCKLPKRLDATAAAAAAGVAERAGHCLLARCVQRNRSVRSAPSRRATASNRRRRQSTQSRSSREKDSD